MARSITVLGLLVAALVENQALAFTPPATSSLRTVAQRSPTATARALSLQDLDWFPQDLFSSFGGGGGTASQEYSLDFDDIVSRLETKLSEANVAETVQAVEEGLEKEVGLLERGLEKLAAIYMVQPLWIQIVSVLLPTIALLLSTLYKISFPPEDYREGFEPYERGSYDPLVARTYYAKHPFLVLQRSLELLRISNKFIWNYLYDKYVSRDEETQRPQRAQELLELIQNAGPTAIKVGQALSVRPDLIPSEYADALSTLQDRVPPFSGQRAKDILRQELGVTEAAKLKDLNFTEGPVASASIGQVYRGTVTPSNSYKQVEVAVKIQRPNVLAEIALDLYIVREFAPFYQKLTGSATDLQSLANEWGRVFIGELAYTEEAANTMRFNQEMTLRNMNAVTAPVVVEEFCTDRVLTTEWVYGKRLDESQTDDVPRLCSVALNAYLVMLLELQTLHCDPHPGNLLRTDDGRLCILDFGMTLDTDPTLQYSLLEFVAHLTSEAYDEVPNDLVKLGFLKKERLDTVRASGFLKPLTYMLQQAGQGGGAEKVRDRIFAEFRAKYPGLSDDDLRTQMRADMKKQIEEARKKESAVSGITLEVEELQKRNRDAFRIPEWFLYTSRAFLTLEGVSLQVDEDYSIIQSCFPYVAKRLLGDDSPRAQQALKDLLYGAGDAIDVDRLSDLADGFSTYTTTTKTINQQAKNAMMESSNHNIVVTDGVNGESVPQQRNGVADKRANLVQAEAAITLAKDSADILLAREGNLVQNLLVEESALAASAQVKDALRDSLVDTPKRIRESLPLGIGSILPPLPLEQGVAPFLKKTVEEEKAQRLINKISNAVPQPAIPATTTALDGDTAAAPSSVNGILSSIDSPEQAALVAKELRENLPKYAPLVGQLGGKFASTLLKTASNNIETTLTEIEETELESDELVIAAAKRLSNIATQGADAINRQQSSTDR